MSHGSGWIARPENRPDGRLACPRPEGSPAQGFGTVHHTHLPRFLFFPSHAAHVRGPEKGEGRVAARTAQDRSWLRPPPGSYPGTYQPTTTSHLLLRFQDKIRFGFLVDSYNTLYVSTFIII
jgi:hypothetical protein